MEDLTFKEEVYVKFVLAPFRVFGGQTRIELMKDAFIVSAAASEDWQTIEELSL
jgi:hypothetical protein